MYFSSHISSEGKSPILFWESESGCSRRQQNQRVDRVHLHEGLRLGIVQKKGGEEENSVGSQITHRILDWALTSRMKTFGQLKINIFIKMKLRKTIIQ